LHDKLHTRDRRIQVKPFQSRFISGRTRSTGWRGTPIKPINAAVPAIGDRVLGKYIKLHPFVQHRVGGFDFSGKNYLAKRSMFFGTF
jgi:hypothetical protein